MGKAEMEVYFREAGLNGYGDYCNRVNGQESKVYARSLVIKDIENDSLLLFINCELGNLPYSVKSTLLDTLGVLGYEQLTDRNIMITATHTHSVTGGYHHYAFYNFAHPGYQEKVLKKIVQGITKSIQMALRSLSAGTIFYNEGKFTSLDSVAFNRSIKAYNRNFPKSQQLRRDQTLQAVDTTMYQLKFTSARGRAVGILNWFGVHGTSVGKVNQSISSDNKGFAASLFEKKFNHEAVAIFAQPASGDVSPLYHGPGQKKKSKTRRTKLKKKGGNGDKIRNIIAGQYEKAEENGFKQYEKALQIYNNTAGEYELGGQIDYDMFYFDLANLDIDPEFVGGLANARTCGAVYGVSFAKATPVDGVGVTCFSRVLLSSMAWINNLDRHFIFLRYKKSTRDTMRAYYRSQGPKKGFVDASNRTILLTNKLRRLWALDPISRCIRTHARAGAFNKKYSLAPHVVPVQIFIIGNLAILGHPGELTTIAAIKLRDRMAKLLAPRGVNKVLISTFANEYIGYVTTEEEYMEQEYEGGHTIFGRWEHAAFMMKFSELATEMLKPPQRRNLDRKLRPPIIPKSELNLRKFDPSRAYFRK